VTLAIHVEVEMTMRGVWRIVVPMAGMLAMPVAAQTQIEMNANAGAKLKAADGALNVAYKKLMTRLTPADKVRLRTSQRAWIVSRDADCQLVSGGRDGGSMAPLVAATCATEETEARTRMLVRLDNCPEGVAMCPL